MARKKNGLAIFGAVVMLVVGLAVGFVSGYHTNKYITKDVAGQEVEAPTPEDPADQDLVTATSMIENNIYA